MQADLTLKLPIFARTINLKYENTLQLSEELTNMPPKIPDYSSGLFSGLFQLFGILVTAIISSLTMLRVGRIQGAASQRAAEANARAITDNGQSQSVNQFQQNILTDLIDIRSIASKCQSETDMLRDKVNMLSTQLYEAGLREVEYKYQIDKQAQQIANLSHELEESRILKVKMQGEIDELRRQLIAHEPISEKK